MLVRQSLIINTLAMVRLSAKETTVKKKTNTVFTSIEDSLPYPYNPYSRDETDTM